LSEGFTEDEKNMVLNLLEKMAKNAFTFSKEKGCGGEMK